MVGGSSYSARLPFAGPVDVDYASASSALVLYSFDSTFLRDIPVLVTTIVYLVHHPQETGIKPLGKYFHVEII